MIVSKKLEKKIKKIIARVYIIGLQTQIDYADDTSLEDLGIKFANYFCEEATFISTKYW